jgi:hypothetical protein
VKDFYNENYKTLKKEIEDITESNLQIQCNSHKNSNVFFHTNGKINAKNHMEVQKTQNSQSNSMQKK